MKEAYDFAALYDRLNAGLQTDIEVKKDALEKAFTALDYADKLNQIMMRELFGEIGLPEDVPFTRL